MSTPGLRWLVACLAGAAAYHGFLALRGAGAAAVAAWRRLRAARGSRPVPAVDGEALLLDLAAQLRSGLTLPQALRAATADADAPLQAPLESAAARADRGDWAGALADLAPRVGLSDPRRLAAALEVYRHTGGHLAPVLEQLAGTLRAAALRREEVRARTAEARWSAGVLAASPALMLAYAARFHPEVLATLLDGPVGRWALAYAGGSWLAGVLALRALLQRALAGPGGTGP